MVAIGQSLLFPFRQRGDFLLGLFQSPAQFLLFLYSFRPFSFNPSRAGSAAARNDLPNDFPDFFIMTQ